MIDDQLRRLHYEICLRFCESCKKHPSDNNLTDEEREMLDDAERLEKMVKKYLDIDL